MLRAWTRAEAWPRCVRDPVFLEALASGQTAQRIFFQQPVRKWLNICTGHIQEFLLFVAALSPPGLPVAAGARAAAGTVTVTPRVTREEEDRAGMLPARCYPPEPEPLPPPYLPVQGTHTKLYL